MSDEHQAMALACAEARKWLGATSPNPPVGAAALNANGEVLAVTAHRRAGELHAEAALIERARTENFLPQIHTLYVTLEPCNHQGRTPPCAETIIQSGIRRVVIGTRDPNPHVKGGGMERLRAAGIEVVCGEDENECNQLIHAFATSVKTGKPWITIKRAFDQKGSMIPQPGHKVFTSQESLCLAHRLRKKSDAIITGSGTVLADNPLFTVRHVPDYPGKRRWLAILDRRGRVPADYIIKAAHQCGLDGLIYQDIHETIADLAAKGAQDILVESGPTLSQALLDAGLWNMSVAIWHHNDTEQVMVEFNAKAPISFAIDTFQWEWFLPNEICEKAP